MSERKKAVSRDRKQSDDTYNARRRYIRSSKRYLEKAEKATGATAARYRSLAQENYRKAVSTYGEKKQKFSKDIREVASRLGITASKLEVTQETKKELIQESTQTLETVMKDDVRRTEREAQAVVNSPEIAHRIMGGLVDVWKNRVPTIDGKLSTKRIIPTLFDYFGVGSYQELLERLEGIVGESLYSMGDNEYFYDSVKLALQDYVAGTALVQ